MMHDSWSVAGKMGTILVVLVIAACGDGSSSTAPGQLAPPSASHLTPDVTVSVNRHDTSGVATMQIGITHGSQSADPWNNANAVARAKRLLADASSVQNQMLYGQGAANPEPRPGIYDWHSLDERIGLIRSMHARPVITLCCAPDWMTSLQATTGTYPNLPPTPEHYRDFAELARQVAVRYRDVKYFQVWNEMKGMWDPASGNWNYVAYTRL